MSYENMKNDHYLLKGTDLCHVILFGLLMALPAGYEPHHFAKVLFAGAWVQSLAYAIVWVAISKKSHFVRNLFFILLLLLFSVETFVYIAFGSRFNPNILTIVLQTNLREISEFISVYIFQPATLMLLAAFILTGTLLFRYKDRQIIPDIRIPRWGTIALPITVVAAGIAVSFISFIPIGKNTLHGMYNTISFVKERHKEVELMKQMTDLTSVEPLPTTKRCPTVVLIIGESHNKHHSSLYGYALPTSTHLEKEHEADRLTVFTDAWTPTNGTSFAMRYIFTLKRCHDKGNEASACILMPAVFRKAGYKVAYFDNQYTRSMGGELDYSCSYFLNPTYINESCFDYRNDRIFDYDGEFIEAYAPHFMTSDKSLNIIHLMGQHFDAAKRFPTSEATFTANDIRRDDLSEKERAQVADYDNAMRYNDKVTGSILQKFRDKDAVVVYLSDHGEQIYDGHKKLFGRQFGSSKDTETLENVYQIPLFIWCSDRYKEKRPEKFQLIQNAAHRKFCLADLPYLLFDLGEITFSEEQKEYSLISPHFREHEIRIE